MITIKTDSRKIKPGDTFVALRGISSDGHDYIEKAIENGAVKIIAEEGNYSVETIIVDDSRKYLERLLKENLTSLTVQLKIRYEDFSTVNIQSFCIVVFNLL